MNYLGHFLKKFTHDLFNLDDDKENEDQIVTSIRRDISFRGTNLWTLIFAIIIASIGLNVNSTAVIIGAMLISPLMGPIMGIGLGIGIYDFDLIKKGMKNVLIAAVISIVSSFFYFLITPLHEANSELLARTSPSLWDVIVAFFGGLAGIVAGTRKTKSNVIPGVAIATALMPPLCTAGFGLASGQWFYFLGALYLFFINSLFICIATVLIVRYLKFKKIEFPSEARRKRVMRYILILIILTVLPSIYLTWRLVQNTVFDEKARAFVQKELQFPRTQVVSKNFIFNRSNPVIELLVVGEELSDKTIDSLARLLPRYNLKNSKLVIRQGLDAKQNIDLAQIKASILEDVFAQEKSRTDTIRKVNNKLEISFPDLKPELKSLYPDMTHYTISQTVSRSLDSLQNDTLTLFIANFRGKFSLNERKKLANWLKERVKTDSVKLVIE